MRYLLASLLLLSVACSDDEVRPPLAIDAAVVVDAAMAVDGPPVLDAPVVDAAPTCAGTTVGGHCWYRGAVNESCIVVCTTHGDVDAATVTYAGAAAAGDRSNLAHCQAIVTAFSGLAFNNTVDNVQDPNDFGCADEPDKNRSELISLNATVASDRNLLVRRYCACSE